MVFKYRYLRTCPLEYTLQIAKQTDPISSSLYVLLYFNRLEKYGFYYITTISARFVDLSLCIHNVIVCPISGLGHSLERLYSSDLSLF